MVSKTKTSLNRWIAFYLGGIVCLVLVVEMFISGVKGNKIPLELLVILLIAFVASNWGWKEIRKIKHR